ncbi:hypothetical protein [Deinococcus soli (ex Cha et al. 2016)]|uniref:hypothetical protein n=1 Tax=Deinococcus soli (ex Cha et al. 2016) TaxID=1309411 RepID=UPI0019CF3F68|nr:hypothetical protein [Deinococcus soli (ex Cha et al. 2016)]GGB67718.1 hypothetical protein GCM10008019_24880 [Deinococcus soli (ex Cha et al. 2016)]
MTTLRVHRQDGQVRLPAPALLTATLTAAGLALTGLASAQTAPAGGFQLPADYFGRFGNTQLVASNTEGFGVRSLPLPLKADLRLTLVKAPTYTDYGLSAQLGSLYAAAGVFYNVPRAELTSAPASGLQWSGVVQGGASHSRFSVGYATQVDGGKVRFLNNVGVAQQGGVTAPYTQSEVSAAYGRTFDRVNTAVYSTARMYAFPVQGKAQGSLDVTLALNAPLAPGLTLDASHFERFAVGEVAIPDFGLGRYESSAATLTYRVPGQAGFGVGALRSRTSRDWTNRVTTTDGDLLLNVGLPVLLGGSVGYEWHDAAPTANRWRFGVSTMPR